MRTNIAPSYKYGGGARVWGLAMLSQNRILRNAVLAILPLSTLVVVAGAAASDQGSSDTDSNASVELHTESSSVGDTSPLAGENKSAEQTTDASTSVDVIHESGVSSSSVTESNVNVQSSGNNQGQSAAVSVNGHNVAIPDSGRVHKTFSDGTSSTTLDISVDNDGAANSGNSNSMNIQISSDSSGNDP